MDSLKDVEHYIANPDDLPADMAAIDALLGRGDDIEASETDDEDEVESPDDAEQAEESAAAGASDEPKDEPQDPGKTEDDKAPILAKDGKHTIPYAVLETERERRLAAERTARDMQARIEAMEARLAAPAQNPPPEPEPDLMSDEDLVELTKDFPAVAKLVEHARRLEGTVKKFEDRFSTLEQQEALRAEEAVAREQAAVRAAVDANPALRYWEQHDPDRWAAAVEADARLRQLPVNQGLSLEDRFTKAVQIVETIFGPTTLPEGYAPTKVSTSPPAKTEDPAEKARAAVEKAGEFKPRTLSEIPGGASPSSDPLEDLASLSTAKLGERMASMTPDQINALLARLG